LKPKRGELYCLSAMRVLLIFMPKYLSVIMGESK
jgi:hypothetical protein